MPVAGPATLLVDADADGMRKMTMVDAWPGLRRAAACGPFFDLDRWDGDGPAVAQPGWYPMTEFAEHPLGLASRVGAVRDSLHARGFGALEFGGASSAVVLRVAASVAFLGLAARLLSPALGAVLIAGVAPDLSWQHLYWRPAAMGVLPLAAGPVEGREMGPAAFGSVGPDRSDTRFVLGTIVTPVLQLGDAVARQFRVPPAVVVGNVASAVAGTIEVASGTHPLAGVGVRLATDLLTAGELAGTGQFVGPTTEDQRTRFRRRSCCQLYRVDGASLCGDCVLHDRSR